jgi:hypothetical protein
MRIASEIKPARENRFAKTAWMAAACLLVATPGLAQDQRTGVSKPQPVTTTTSDDEIQSAIPVPATKPSAAVPAMAPQTVYGPYVPYRPAGSATAPAPAFDPDANIVTEATAGGSERRPLNPASQADPDAGIVTHVPWRADEVPDGALLKVRLRESISTATTRPGTRFSAEVSEPVVGDGRVYIPAGSILEGRVTWARGGSRISGGAAIHLETRTVTLPDGTQYPLHARVIDTTSWNNTKVDREGTIMRKEHTKGTLATVGLATGGGIAAGAMIGGLPGALIGAGVGAGVSTVVWLKQERQAVLPKDLGVVFSLTTPMSVTPARAAVGTVGMRTPGGE